MKYAPSIATFALLALTPACSLSLRIGSSSQGAEAAQSGEIGQELHALLDAWSDAYNAHDAAKIAALYAPDADLLTEEGETVRGQAAILAYWSERMKISPDVATVQRSRDIRVLDANTAIETGTWSDDHREDGGAAKKHGIWTCVYTKVGGAWKILVERGWELKGS